jgi:hypothetical protein
MKLSKRETHHGVRPTSRGPGVEGIDMQLRKARA